MFASSHHVETQPLVVEERWGWLLSRRNHFEIVKQDFLYSSVQRMVCEYQRNPGHLFLRWIAFGKGVALSQVFQFLEVTFQSLCAVAATITHDDHDNQSKLVVTKSDDLPLSEAEKTVLNKGLSFVPVKKSTDEYQVKADCEKFYRRLRLRAHFHNEEASDSQATPDTGHLLRQFWHFHKHSSQEFHYPGELSEN